MSLVSKVFTPSQHPWELPDVQLENWKLSRPGLGLSIFVYGQLQWLPYYYKGYYKIEIRMNASSFIFNDRIIRDFFFILFYVFSIVFNYGSRNHLLLGRKLLGLDQLTTLKKVHLSILNKRGHHKPCSQVHKRRKGYGSDQFLVQQNHPKVRKAAGEESSQSKDQILLGFTQVCCLWVLSLIRLQLSSETFSPSDKTMTLSVSSS